MKTDDTIHMAVAGHISKTHTHTKHLKKNYEYGIRSRTMKSKRSAADLTYSHLVRRKEGRPANAIRDDAYAEGKDRCSWGI